MSSILLILKHTLEGSLLYRVSFWPLDGWSWVLHSCGIWCQAVLLRSQSFLRQKIYRRGAHQTMIMKWWGRFALKFLLLRLDYLGSIETVLLLQGMESVEAIHENKISISSSRWRERLLKLWMSCSLRLHRKTLRLWFPLHFIVTHVKVFFGFLEALLFNLFLKIFAWWVSSVV